MMNSSLKQQPKTRGYKSIPHANAAADDAKITAVPVFGSTLLSRRMAIAIIAGTSMVLMLMLVAGGVVWMPDRDRTTTATAEGLIVATEPTSCVPATGTFGGVSTTDITSTSAPFQTCFRDAEWQHLCWTQSYCVHDNGDACFLYNICAPDDGWQPVENDDMHYNIPVTHPYFCGGPCHDVQAY